MARIPFNSTNRRGFLGQFAAGAAAIGLSTLIPPLSVAAAEEIQQESTADAWFAQIKGKHRMVFDVTAPHDMLPFAWPRVYLLSNEKTGTPQKDCSTVVVLRHESIPFAMEDRLWQKYKFGEVFKINDPATKAPAIRNVFWKPKPGEMKIPGIGAAAIGINELQDSGVMFCVCNMALTVYSAVVAQNLKQDAEVVKKDWMAGILPKIQVVPSGVWAIDRAQEHNCSYCFVG